jgi:ADP-heptose:LPS heptosyltransferase
VNVLHPKFLLTRFSSIGDIVLTAPVVHALRTHYGPEARIDLVTLARFRGAAELIGGLDEIHTIERTTSEVAPTLAELNFDYLIDLHSNVRSRSLARTLNIMTFKVPKLSAPRLSLVLGMRKKPVEHFVDRSLALLSPFSIAPDLSNPWGTINSKAPELELPSKFIALTPGAAHLGKQLPTSTLEAICSTLVDTPFIILGGPDMASLGDSLEAQFPHVTSLCGKASLSNTAYVLEKSSLAIGGDTGAMHIATAVGTPLISVWGCTRPSLGLAPWHPHPDSILLEPEGRGTRPCSRHGAKCRHKKLGKDLCVNHVDPQRIISAVRKLIK